MKDNKKGYTLVEIIVCFALIGIFMSATSVVLSTFFETSFKMNSINQAQTLSMTLMDTISGELSVAAATQIEAESKVDKEFIRITDGRIEFVDKYGYPVAIYLQNKKLILEYTNKDEGTSDTSEWGFGEGVYMDNEIESLSFKKIADSNVIEVVLKLENIRTGYVAEKQAMIECYNVKSGDIKD